MLRNYYISQSSILKNTKIDDTNEMVYFITFVIGVFGLIIHILLLFFFFHIRQKQFFIFTNATVIGHILYKQKQSSR